MKIKIIDSNENYLCEFNINYLSNPNRLDNFKNCLRLNLIKTKQFDYITLKLKK